MPFVKDKARAALAVVASKEKGAIALCKLKSGENFAAAALERPLKTRDEAIAHLVKSTGLTRDEIDLARCCVLDFTRLEPQVLLQLNKAASAGAWNAKTATEALRKAYTAAGATLPSILMDSQDKKGGLDETMNKPREGDSLATRMDRAVEKAKSASPEARAKAKASGLQPMDEGYLGELLDHQRNRYGRVLPQLLALWKQHDAGRHSSFSDWLEAVETGKNVPGAQEARATNFFGTAHKIVQPGGTDGGRVTYLDEKERAAYVAQAKAGVITGAKIAAAGEFIFVIGSDDKLYAAAKQRAAPGKEGAFNHSSFFSGAPVKSAGMIKVQGGRIVEVNDTSGHYTPNEAMIVTAVKRFFGTDAQALARVAVVCGGKVTSGTDFLSPASERPRAQARQSEVWAKYSLGDVTRDEAERLLQGKPDGSWLVRTGSNGNLVVSALAGKAFRHSEAADIGALGLDRKKLLEPKGASAPPKKSLADQVEALRIHAAYHRATGSAEAETILKSQPLNAWLLRDSSTGTLALSWRSAQDKVSHALVTSEQTLQQAQTFMAQNAALAVRP